FGKRELCSCLELWLRKKHRSSRSSLLAAPNMGKQQVWKNVLQSSWSYHRLLRGLFSLAEHRKHTKVLL
ncbi:hypothetical protein, partial [Enterococcus faecalis]|uniref:hypothetical protein n=1 Tax=Enterococcus faecalis TaxID=1351 RepID=UPI003D6A9956